MDESAGSIIRVKKLSPSSLKTGVLRVRCLFFTPPQVKRAQTTQDADPLERLSALSVDANYFEATSSVAAF